MGAYLLITLTFSCQHDQLVGVYSDRLKNRGLRHGSGQKRGVLGTGQARKKGGLRHGSGQKRGVFTAAHTCTGHICECPPPRGWIPESGKLCPGITGSVDRLVREYYRPGKYYRPGREPVQEMAASAEA